MAHDDSENRIQSLHSENVALKGEITKLCDQLAQRTCLHVAQDRCWKESLRTVTHNLSENHATLQDTSSRLEQALAECARLAEKLSETEKLAAYYTAQNTDLNMQLEEALTRIVQLDKDLADTIAKNISLENSVDILRSSDVTELEQGRTVYMHRTCTLYTVYCFSYPDLYLYCWLPCLTGMAGELATVKASFRAREESLKSQVDGLKPSLK